MDITKITDINELRALRGDQYQLREEANGTIQTANHNINVINQRIEELSKANQESETEE